MEILTGSNNPGDYWFKVKIRVKMDDGLELSTICRQFKPKAADGKMLETDCANTQNLLRLIQSIPSPKAEPFKQWLAKVFYKRMQEIQNTEMGLDRARENFQEFAFLTNIIHQEWTGLSVKSDKNLKGFKKLCVSAPLR